MDSLGLLSPGSALLPLDANLQEEILRDLQETGMFDFAQNLGLLGDVQARQDTLSDLGLSSPPAYPDRQQFVKREEPNSYTAQYNMPASTSYNSNSSYAPATASNPRGGANYPEPAPPQATEFPTGPHRHQFAPASGPPPSAVARTAAPAAAPLPPPRPAAGLPPTRNLELEQSGHRVNMEAEGAVFHARMALGTSRQRMRAAQQAQHAQHSAPHSHDDGGSPLSGGEASELNGHRQQQRRRVGSSSGRESLHPRHEALLPEPSGKGNSNKGLRHFSMKVCEKVESKGRTTYNEVADELVNELSKTTTAGEAHYDEKNIRRRVYDAINVLMAMGIIQKEKKDIIWRGFPEGRRENVDKLRADRRAKTEEVARKQEFLEELTEQQVALTQLLARNPAASTSAANTPLQLPFILVQARPDATVEVRISEDMHNAQFDFYNSPFQIHDDSYVLRVMADHARQCNKQERPVYGEGATDPSAASSYAAFPHDPPPPHPPPHRPPPLSGFYPNSGPPQDSPKEYMNFSPGISGPPGSRSNNHDYSASLSTLFAAGPK